MKIISLFIVLFLTSCGASSTLAPLELNEELELAPEVEARQLLQALDSESQSIRRLRAQASLRVKRGVVSEEFRQIVVFERPDKLRVDLFEPALNQLVLLVAMNSSGVKAYRVQEREAIVGPPGMNAIYQLLAVPLKPEEAMLWYTGTFRPPDQELIAIRKVFRHRAEPTRYLVHYALRDSRVIRVEVHRTASGPVLQGIRIWRPDTKQEMFATQYHYPKGPGVLGGLTVSLPQDGVELEITYQDFMVNGVGPKQGNRYFDIQFPFGAKVRRL